MSRRCEPLRETPSRIVLDHELNQVRLLLQEYAGVLIDCPTEVLGVVVEEVLISHGFRSAAELIARMHASPVDCQLLLESVVRGDTAFFRPAGLFTIFQNEVLADMARRNDDETLRPLRIFSAGCSTGEEAYSIAMSVCEAFASKQGSWKVHIVAGDIRRDALKFAERGLYPAGAVLHLPDHLVASYFSRIGDHLLVKPRLRDLVTFTPMNLTENTFIGRFQCIFCVDVLPQLSAAGKAAAWQRLQLALEPGGYIYLGEHEQLPGGSSLLRHSAGVYQRPLAAAAGAGK
ncbi:MAG TPA: CheR family methyltransferase [Terriglobales bacterium]|nr:CheR family methyltransferase [Terriglobales bacterium]